MYLFPESLEHLFIAISVCMGEITERERRREAHICLGLCFYGCAGCGWRREMAKNLFHSVCIRLNWGRDTRIPWLRVRESWRKKNSRSSLFHLVFSPSSLSSPLSAHQHLHHSFTGLIYILHSALDMELFLVHTCMCYYIKRKTRQKVSKLLVLKFEWN